MPTYRQDHSFYEDAYGTDTISFVVSDTYEGVFSSESIRTDIFILSDSSHDLELSEGVQSEDEVQLKMNEILVETDDDRDAFDFVLLGTHPANKRFCAVFINTGETPDIADAEFTGVLRPAFKGNDLYWHGNPFTETPTPLREWTISAQSFFTNIFDEVELNDLVFGNESLMVSPISEGGWVTSNVANREGYARLSSNRITKYAQLVNLNKLLARMADKLTESLSLRGLGEYEINFIETTLDFKLSPARPASTSASRYVYGWIDSNWSAKVSDAVSIVMGDIGASSDANSLHVSYSLFDTSVVTKTAGGAEDTYKITGVLKKFTDLLYAIAANVGCFVEFSYTDSVTLNVAFLPRRSTVKNAVFIRDVTKADLDTQPRHNGKNDTYYSNSFGLAKDGWDSYTSIFSKNNALYPSAKVKEQKGGKRLPFSVSPTLRAVEFFTEDNGGTWRKGAFPHNVIMYDDGSPTNRNDSHCGMESVDSQGITTALYLNVVRNGEYGFSGGERLYAPAAMVTAKINDENKKFETLSEYINFITARDSVSFETEYNLTVPFLCGFRRSADGSHADDDGGRGSWKNLKLGSSITIDTIEYVVIGIKRALGKPETTLRLHAITRFSFGEAESLTSEVSAELDGAYVSSGVILPDDEEVVLGINSYGNYISGEAFSEGDFVTLLSDGKVYKSQAYHSHVLKIAGIATQTITEADEVIKVLEEGKYSSSRYSFLPSEPLFIRTSDEGDFNASHSQLDYTTETEDTYIEIAQAKNSNTLLIKRGFEFVYSPCISDS